MLGLVFGCDDVATRIARSLHVGSWLSERIAGRLADACAGPAVMADRKSSSGFTPGVPFFFRGIDSVYASLWARFHPGFYGFAVSRFLLASLVLALPTILMGATLPVLSSALTQSRRVSTSVARFYTYNLVGAIIGALMAGFFLLPTFGVRATIWIAAAINLMMEPARSDRSTTGDGSPRVRLNSSSLVIQTE